MKVVTVVGTRPEVIRLSRVIPALDHSVSHVLVHTGQNYDYELNEIFFKELGIRKPDYVLNAAGKSAAETIGNVIAKSDAVFTETQPDALLVLGDTNSCLAALAAKRQRIPVFHMEAGNRCFDERVPEEINRRIIDHISDINLPYSIIAREYLLKEGLPPDRIIKTGSPMYEVLHHYLPAIRQSDVLDRLELRSKAYFVGSCHREENVDNPANLAQFVSLLNQIAQIYGLPVIVSTHPRTRKRLTESNASLNPLVTLLPPLGFLDFVHLEIHARATLSDSGTISEESSILGFPAINLRQAHERPEAMEETAVMLTGLDPERTLHALRVLESQEQTPWQTPADYQHPNVSAKIVRIILSYVDYVNRVVWRKN